MAWPCRSTLVQEGKGDWRVSPTVTMAENTRIKQGGRGKGEDEEEA